MILFNLQINLKTKTKKGLHTNTSVAVNESVTSGVCLCALALWYAGVAPEISGGQLDVVLPDAKM